MAESNNAEQLGVKPETLLPMPTRSGNQVDIIRVVQTATFTPGIGVDGIALARVTTYSMLGSDCRGTSKPLRNGCSEQGAREASRRQRASMVRAFGVR